MGEGEAGVFFAGLAEAGFGGRLGGERMVQPAGVRLGGRSRRRGERKAVTVGECHGGYLAAESTARATHRGRR